MSLLQESMEFCQMVDKTTVKDGYGGIKTVWVLGAELMASIVFDTSMQARIADHQGVTALYTITTNKSVILQYHDVLRRSSDGKIFRVTSDGDDNRTPASAGLNMRQVTAEEWELSGELNG